tara:strand:+ start:489 stop:632 length:144 start_codon:yes stop_codon:yes gene_type:complete
MNVVWTALNVLAMDQDAGVVVAVEKRSVQARYTGLMALKASLINGHG